CRHPCSQCRYPRAAEGSARPRRRTPDSRTRRPRASSRRKPRIIAAKELKRATGFRVKRVYDPPDNDDGYRVLIDRMWPRGMKKETAPFDEWLKDIAPSKELIRWFGHDPDKWPEFRKRYA